MSNQPAPLALRFNAPAAFGTNEEMNAIVERMGILMPINLTDWQLEPENRTEAERDLSNAYFKVAQIAVFYQLVPGIDIHIMTRGGKFIVDVGLESWRKAADRYCAMMRISYHIHTEPMTVEEVKTRRGNHYMPGDVGATATLWRSDKESAYARFGESSMTKASGAWVEKASWNKYDKKWIPDTIPNQRTKEDVAERRAIRAVLKKEFSLDSLLAATPAEIRQNIQYLESDIQHEQMRRAVPNDRRPEIDENGFIVIEATAPRHTAQDWQFIIADEPDVDDTDEGPDFDDAREEEEPEMEESNINYRAIAANFTGNEKTLLDWAKKYRDEGGPASKAQYNFLSGEIDKLTTKKGHNLLLGVLIGREVTGANPPSFKVCKLLLDFILKEVTAKDDNGKPVTDADGVIVKVANPYFRQDVVDRIKAMWQTITTTPESLDTKGVA